MQNRWLTSILVVVGLLLVLCLCLDAGVFVMTLTPHADGRPIGLFRRLFIFTGEHGAIGQISTIHAQTITLRLPDGATQTILVNKDTRIERSRQRITLLDLQVNDHVAVIGSPNSQGEIDANWIGVFGPTNFEPSRVMPTRQTN